MKDEKEIPRWQQGPRPGAFGDVWDAMTPKERRSAFISDWIVALIGVAIIYGVGTYLGLS